MSIVKLKSQVPKELGCITVVRVIHEPGYEILEDNKILLVDTDKGLHWIGCPLEGIVHEPQPVVGDRLDLEGAVFITLETDIPATSAEVDFSYEFTEETPEEIEEAIKFEIEIAFSPTELADFTDGSNATERSNEVTLILKKKAQERKPDGTFLGAIFIILVGAIIASLSAYAPKFFYGEATSGLWALVPIVGLLWAAMLSRGILAKTIFSIVFALTFIVNPIRGFEDQLPRWVKGSDILGHPTSDLSADIEAWDKITMSPEQVGNAIQVMPVKWDLKATTNARAILILEITNGTNGILKNLEVDPMNSEKWRPLAFDPPIYPLESKTVAIDVPLGSDQKPNETKGRTTKKRWHTVPNRRREVDIRPFNRIATFAQEGRSWIFAK